jgi:hypothetical protein
MRRNSRTGIRRLLGALRFCAMGFVVAAFVAAGFFGKAFATSHDFNGDARSDVLWYNVGTHETVIWLMNGASVIGGGSLGSVGLGWQIVGQRDFNGDGRSDILWHNFNSGQVVIWLMDGLTVIGGGSPGTVPTIWAVYAVGDFNADGKGDILWWNRTTGEVVIWLMDGVNVIGGGSPGTVPFVSVSGWQLNGIGDFNADGKSDIVWYNRNTGQVLIWLMNGASVIGGGSPGSADPTYWAVLGAGDFNGDGKSDILWGTSYAAQVVIWLMDGLTVIGGGSPAAQTTAQSVAAPIQPWHVHLVGDFNGDGTSDILWQHAGTGQVVIWLISGTSVIGGGSPGVVGSGWEVAAAGG